MEAAGAAAHPPGAPRSIRGRPSGLKAAAHRLRRRPCGPALTPETAAAPRRQQPRARPGPAPAAHGTPQPPAGRVRL